MTHTLMTLPSRWQIILASKLATGDGAWSTSKVILGWHIDTAAGTIHLPTHKAQCLHNILNTYLLFSILQQVLVDQPNAARLHLGPLIK
jgi:hypothetical protein